VRRWLTRLRERRWRAAITIQKYMRRFAARAVFKVRQSAVVAIESKAAGNLVVNGEQSHSIGTKQNKQSLGRILFHVIFARASI
jgi:hypothetical protein